ncbi:MAG: hypothetical protein ACOX6J_05205 [Oscillospiraceae bacterium]|jgi:hypothetical protein
MSAMIAVLIIWCLYENIKALINAPTPWDKTVWFFFVITILLTVALVFTVKKAIREYNERKKDEAEAKKIIEERKRAQERAKYGDLLNADAVESAESVSGENDAASAAPVESGDSSAAPEEQKESPAESEEAESEEVREEASQDSAASKYDS